MLANGLARRFAYPILAFPSVGTSTVRTIIAFGLITCLLSAFISNSATVAMLLPTAVAILGAVTGAMKGDQDPHRLRVSIALPICIVILAVLLITLNKPEVRRLDALEEHVEEERGKLGALSVAERKTLIAFAVAVVGWFAPGVVGIVAGDTSSASEPAGVHADLGRRGEDRLGHDPPVRLDPRRRDPHHRSACRS